MNGIRPYVRVGRTPNIGASLGNAMVIMTARTPRIAFQFQW
jgi:hypothetical protein